MAWIEVHQALPTHRKLLDLAEALQVKPVVALGHLVSFWLWALDNAPDGNITAISKKTMAFAAQFPKSADGFFQGMLSSRWFDDAEGCITIHDWDDYAGRLVLKRADNKERMRQTRTAQVQRTNNARAQLPNHTVPNRTLPIYIETLRTIPGWKERGESQEDNLVLWAKRKSLTDDQLERSAIGLGKTLAKTLREYTSLARAFQDRVNKGYDCEEKFRSHGNNSGDPQEGSGEPQIHYG